MNPGGSSRHACGASDWREWFPIHALCCGVLAGAAGVAGGAMASGHGEATEQVRAAVRETVPGSADFIGYLNAETQAVEVLPGWPGLKARRLSGDPATGRLALHIELPAGWRLRRAPVARESIEIVMLDGRLRMGREILERYDFGFVPPGGRMPALSSVTPVSALMFFDPPAADAMAVERQRRRGVYVTSFAADRWQPASLAKGAGAMADLSIQHLKKDPFTSARTWYIRLGAGAAMPWEVHTMVEEGYLMQGQYRIAECLPTRTVSGAYAAGDYFWRPGGIPHRGGDMEARAAGPIDDAHEQGTLPLLKGSVPSSNLSSEVIWLQRTQVALDVRFFGQCIGGAAAQPLAR